MSRLETQYYDEMFADEDIDSDAIVDEMINHQDLVALCALAAKGILHGDVAVKMLEDIYEDAKSRVNERYEDEDYE